MQTYTPGKYHPVDQGPQHETRHSKPERKKKVGNKVEHMGTEDFLDRTPLVYSLRSMVNKWAL